MQAEVYSFSNGLRMIHIPSNNPVSYCGFAINAGARDEAPTEYGLTHLVEHLLYKGTKKRKACHILNRMENVGGELNAYTTKEETFIYTVSLNNDTERAVELLADIVSASQFPENEIRKEKEVVLDEINLYKDSPSELIFDDFENLIFDGHALGHHILGEKKTLKTFNREQCVRFFHHFYQPDNMIFFCYGATPLKKLVAMLSKYLPEPPPLSVARTPRLIPELNCTRQSEINKKLHQTHVMIGAKAYDMRDDKKTGLYLLNNLLGGPGMNSRLNLTLRERYGLVYTVESGYTAYSDTGVISIYFGCDHQSKDRCIDLTYKELCRLRTEKLSTARLSTAKKQLKGQLGISAEHRENVALSIAKSFLHLNKYNDLPQVYRMIDDLSASLMLEIANEVLEENKLFRLIFS